jgi:hypothetical protein
MVIILILKRAVKKHNSNSREKKASPVYAREEERMYTSQKQADRGMILNRNRMNIDPMRSRTKGKPRRRRYRETKR